MIKVIYIFTYFQNRLPAANTKARHFTMKHQLEIQGLWWVVLN